MDHAPSRSPILPDKPSVIEFQPFRLDLRDGRLWQGQRPVVVRPKTYAVLRYLAERPGALVTRDEILDAVWGDVTVPEMPTCG